MWTSMVVGLHAPTSSTRGHRVHRSAYATAGSAGITGYLFKLGLQYNVLCWGYNTMTTDAAGIIGDLRIPVVQHNVARAMSFRIAWLWPCQ